MIEEGALYVCPNCGNSASASVVGAVMRQGLGSGTLRKQHKLSLSYRGFHRPEGASITSAPETVSPLHTDMAIATRIPTSGVTFRQRGFLPLLVFGMILLLTTSLLIHSRHLFVVTIALSPFWLYGLFVSLSYVSITDSSLVLGTTFTPLKVVVNKADLVSCQRYLLTINKNRLIIHSLWFVTRQWDRPGSRSFHPGVGISVYGWGRQRQELFRTLATWLSGAPVAVDEQTKWFIENASR